MDFGYFSPVIDGEMLENAAGVSHRRMLGILATLEIYKPFDARATSMHSALQWLTIQDCCKRRQRKGIWRERKTR